MVLTGSLGRTVNNDPLKRQICHVSDRMQPKMGLLVKSSVHGVNETTAKSLVNPPEQRSSKARLKYVAA